MQPCGFEKKIVCSLRPSNTWQHQSRKMDILLGLVGKDYVMTVADQAQARSIVVFKHNEDKIFELDSRITMGTAGPQGDRANFSDFIQRNIQLYKYRNDLEMTVKAAANFTRWCYSCFIAWISPLLSIFRKELATALRKGPYQVNMLIGGYDKKGPSLYYMDYMASMHKMDFAAHGYGSYFTLRCVVLHLRCRDLSLLFQYFRPLLQEGDEPRGRYWVDAKVY